MDEQHLPLHFDEITTQPIEAEWLKQMDVTLDVLRLDKLHPVVSGNKWFKLQCYFSEAHKLKVSAIATFGGAFSNHILATAYACKVVGLESYGFIRGENTHNSSFTLQQAELYGMKLMFLSRSQYKQKEEIKDEFSRPNWYWIAEGGYGVIGARGAEGILAYADGKKYSHILASVGTGTMLAGLMNSSSPTQQVIGISSMKGNFALENEVQSLLNKEALQKPLHILHDYHFGGYGKSSKELIEFMREAYYEHNLPLDFVYTGKLFFAIKDLVKKNYFKKGSTLLMIHSGGLQGNKSLPQNALSFL